MRWQHIAPLACMWGGDSFQEATSTVRLPCCHRADGALTAKRPRPLGASASQDRSEAPPALPLPLINPSRTHVAPSTASVRRLAIPCFFTSSGQVTPLAGPAPSTTTIASLSDFPPYISLPRQSYQFQPISGLAHSPILRRVPLHPEPQHRSYPMIHDQRISLRS